VTRLADITGLDVVGVPVYQSIRPNSRNVSVSNGKGLTRDQAKVSALMESLETFHAEELTQPTVRAQLDAMRRELAYDPHTLAVVRTPHGSSLREVDYDPFFPPLGAPSFLRDETPLDWVRATDLHTGAATWAPKQACELNLCVRERLWVPFFRATSNGLASGNTVIEALLHGLSEVVERDCIHRNPAAWSDSERCIDLTTIVNRPARGVLRRFERAGLKVQIVNLSGPVTLPCFEVNLSDAANVAYQGFGCHPSREAALVRALTEAAQSRLGHIAGTRDDLYRGSYGNGLLAPGVRESDVFAVKPRGRFYDCPDQPIGRWRDTLHETVARIRAVTGLAPLAVDLTRPEFGLPVVRVLAPGLGFAPTPRP
jgi:ribosomal protein S12 methylthiotransferase accessory factor